MVVVARNSLLMLRIRSVKQCYCALVFVVLSIEINRKYYFWSDLCKTAWL